MAISNLKQFMAYLPYPLYARLKKYSIKHGINMSQIIRESLDARLSDGSQYMVGYNAAITEAMSLVDANKAAKMRFPSGASFAEIINRELKRLIRNGNEEEPTDPRSTEGGPGQEGQGDPDLGI